MTMYRILLLVLGFSVSLCSQSRTITFAYIAHDVDTPVELMTKRLQQYYRNIRETGDANDRTIIYLASYNRPIVADLRREYANIDDMEEQTDNFDRILREFERDYHNISGEYDAKRIIELFSGEDDFITSDGKLADDIDNVIFEFYVTPYFWSSQMNQAVIASVFYALDIARFLTNGGPEFSSKIQMQIFSTQTVVDYDKEISTQRPFGLQNLNNINEILTGLNAFNDQYPNY